jgi:putative ATP-binding cassette transporter
MSMTNLTWVTAGFGWITAVAPTLVAAPLYFSGKISFGGLMMAAAAFTQAQSSLRWFVDNFGIIADWRATLLRVATFRYALTSASDPQTRESRIVYVEGDGTSIVIEDLEVDSPVGRDQLQERALTVRSGERVLIVGAPGTGKTLLFRAIAGLWPWGSGKVTRPADASILYMPGGTPYLPRGTLREVLAYPRSVTDFGDSAYAHALQRLGLERLVGLLDESRRWDRELSQDEQRGLSFARVVLQAPPWVLMDDVIGTLDEEALQRVVEAFSTDLTNTAIIHIGRAVHTRDPFFLRVLHLVKAPSPAADTPPPGGAP